MTRTLQNFVAGDWVDATGSDARTVVSPVTGETLAEAPNASPEDVRRATAAAHAAQPAWAALSVFDRAEVMHRIGDLLEERKEELARSLTLENGKPYKAEALDDIHEMADNFRSSAEDAKRLESSVIPTQDAAKRMFTIRVPNGVYAAITPWNFPGMIPAELVAPGIAVGNTFVVKPSEWTPIAMADFMQTMADAGLPDGVVNVIYGGGDVGEWLVTDDHVNGIAFVGSHTTGEKIVRAAGLKRTLIEASGNGPVVVCADADLELAAKGAVYGAFYCAGQVCAATERVLVDSSVYEEFQAAVVAEAEGWILGDPFDDATLGRADAERADRGQDGRARRGRGCEGRRDRGRRVARFGAADGAVLPADRGRERGARHAREPRRDVRADRAADLGGRRRRRARGRERVASRAPGGGLYA